jgi:hypothetical protein
MPLVAFGVFGWLMFSDSLISRYFLYGLVILLLCRRSLRYRFYLPSVGWLTFVILVTAWSHFGLDVLGYQAVLNPLNPVHNEATRAIQALFFDDRFITLATVANVMLLVLLGFFAIKGAAPQIGSDEHQETRRDSAPAGFKVVAESGAA